MSASYLTADNLEDFGVTDRRERERDCARFETSAEKARREDLEELDRRAAAFAESARPFAKWCSDRGFLDRRAIEGNQMTHAQSVDFAVDLIAETLRDSWINKETHKALGELDG